MDDTDPDTDIVNDFEEDKDSSDPFSKRGRQSKLPVAEPMFPSSSGLRGFRQSTTMCLEHIREAMLHHRWQEATEYMVYFPQILQSTSEGSTQQNKELVWRLCTEILHHHPNSTLQDYNNIYERMKHSSSKHYLMISLEHAFHLMLHGCIEDAKHQLSVAQTWRYGKESVIQYQKTKLIHAYSSLLDYINWCDKKSANDGSDHDVLVENTEMQNSFRQVSSNLKEILKHPGVWDPFILSYVEMLEFYQDHTTALSVLKNYAHDSSFPPNPNAQVYLYQYVKRHGAPQKKLLKILKTLHVLVPSHELMLEYSSLLLQSKKTCHGPKALEILLDMLDFSCWRTNLDVWKLLKAVIEKLQLKPDWKTIILKRMSGRTDWWPALHFTRAHATTDSEENPELWAVKASLTKILCPDVPQSYVDAGDTSEEQIHTAL